MSSAWSQLDQLLTCAICLDRYRNPKLLPCQHTFCVEPCMDGLIDYARRQIKCPECRAEHRIPYKGIQEFPTNVTLMRFLELHRDITGEEPEPPISMMERCSVCSEKASLEKCAHCEKKICPDCKEAHVDILRREINRINHQVRRGLHRLSDALSQTKKNADKLRLNCAQVKDEIEDIVRRYSKDLKHTEDKLQRDLEVYTESELKAINKLKDDLESEVSNMTSNCDLAEKYIKDDAEWSDAELLEYKDIFLKTLDFLRSFETDTSDFSRRIKFQSRADPDVLHRNVADFGELKIIAPPSSMTAVHQPPIAQPPSNALMRSQSDHRLAAQFARRSDTRSYTDRYGGHTSDNEREGGRPTSPLYGRNRRENESSGYRRYSERNRDYDYERPSNRYSREDNTLSSRWRDGEDYGHRSRLNRDCDDYDSEPQYTGRTVRFADDPPQRERLFEVDVATKGPLSGVIKLMDSPKVMERLHQNEVRQKQVTDKDAPTATAQTNPSETRPVPQPIPPQRKTPARQQSEDDIDRQKKVAQQQQSTSTSSAPSPQPSSEVPQRTRDNNTEVPKLPTAGRPLRKEATETTERESSPLPPTSPLRETTVRKPTPSTTENAEESDSSSTNSSRFNRSTLGKTLTYDGSESTTAQPVFDKKVQITKQPAAKLNDRRFDNDSIASEDLSRPVQSSFFSRQRRLPDPEPRLLQTQESDDDKDDDADEESSESEEEEAEEEEESEEEESESEEEVPNEPPKQTLIASSTNPQPIKQEPTQDMESESEESTTESSSSESESEESDEEEEGGNNQKNGFQNSPNPASKIVTDHSVNANNNRFSSPTQRYNEDITEDGEIDINVNGNYNCDESSKVLGGAKENTSRRRSEDNESSDGSSDSGNYQSFSNTPSVMSNGTVDENVTSDSNLNKNEAGRFARRHPTLSRSKSSHELGVGFDPEDNFDDEVDNSPSYHSARQEQTVDEPTTIQPAPRARPKFEHQRSVDSPLSSTNSSWANYLKNKYGSAPTSKVIPRSRSSHSLYQKSDSDSSGDETNSCRDRLSGSTGFSNPRSTYLQKRRMLYKFGSRGSEPGNFTWPRGIAVGPDDSVVVADSSNHRVQVFDSLGNFLFEFGSYGSCEGQFDCLSGVSVNRIGQYIVSDRYNQRVQLFDPAGRFLRAFGTEGRTDGRFNCPWGITTDSLGFIYVCDKENHRIQVFQSDGTFVGKFGGIGSRPGQLENPHYIAVSNTNRVVVSDSNNHRIQIFDVNGRTLSTFGSEGSADGQFKFPRGVAVDDQGFIVVGDSGNNRIQIFHPDGTYLRGFGTWGSGDSEFKGLEGIAVTSAGSILVCDRENHRIQVF